VVFAAKSGHAVMNYSDDESEISTHEVQSEHPVIMSKELLRAFKIIQQYCGTHGSDEKLDISLFVFTGTCKGDY
jgi:hypothetical protein